MIDSPVDALLFRLGPIRLAVELHLVSSVLAVEEAHGMGQLDPRPFLRENLEDPELFGAPEEVDDHYRVGLVIGGGPPMVLLLGEILGARTLRRADFMPIPHWLGKNLPPILRPACLEIDEKVVWLLDLDTLKTTPAPE